jgi:hypothetical protein
MWEADEQDDELDLWWDEAWSASLEDDDAGDVQVTGARQDAGALAQAKEWMALAAGMPDVVDRLRLEMLVTRWQKRHATAAIAESPNALAAEALTLEQIGSLLLRCGLTDAGRAALESALPLALASAPPAIVAALREAIARLQPPTPPA